MWCASLDQPGCISSELKSTLSIDERQRADRFRFDQEKERYSVARGLLRRIVSDCIGERPAAIQFEYGPQGKPSLGGRFAGLLSFNLSHSGRVVLIAVTRLGGVGVDVERVCWLAEAEHIVDRCFTDEERDAFQKTQEGAKLKKFFQIWTCKESILKCIGLGIAQIDTRQEWSFSGCQQELEPADGYVGSIAISSVPLVMRTWQWMFR